MATYSAEFKDESGTERLTGTIELPDALQASTLRAVVVSATPPTAGQNLQATSATAAAWTTPPTPTVRIAAGVPMGAPTGTELPIAVDTTAVSGGVYAWNGAAWVKAATV